MISRPHRSARITRLLAPVAVVVLIGSLAGCSNDDAGAATTTPAAASANADTTTPDTVTNDDGAASQSTSPPTVPSITEVPTLDGEVGAKSDAVATRCEPQGDGWLSEGTVTNPTDGAVDYAVVVSFLDAAGVTLGAEAAVLTDVEPAASAVWSIGLPVQGDDIQCVLRVTRAAAS